MRFLAAITAFCLVLTSACSLQWTSPLFSKNRIERPSWLEGVWLSGNNSKETLAFRNVSGKEIIVFSGEDYILVASAIYTTNGGATFVNVDTKSIKTLLGRPHNGIGFGKAQGYFSFLVERLNSNGLDFRHVVDPQKLESPSNGRIKNTCPSEKKPIPQNPEGSVLDIAKLSCYLIDPKYVEERSAAEYASMIGPVFMRFTLAAPST